MRKVFFWGAAVLTACLIGATSSLAALIWMGLANVVSSGPWMTDPTTGSTEAGLYTRALVAVKGLFALDKEETVYYTAITDSSGQPLSGDCTYRIEGTALPARWWSITAYGPDNYLIDTGFDRYSIDASSVAYRADGSFTAWISAAPKESNWLPVASGQPFDLTARLYNPEPGVYAALAATELPQIVRERCS